MEEIKGLGMPPAMPPQKPKKPKEETEEEARKRREQVLEEKRKAEAEEKINLPEGNAAEGGESDKNKEKGGQIDINI